VGFFFHCHDDGGVTIFKNFGIVGFFRGAIMAEVVQKIFVNPS